MLQVYGYPPVDALCLEMPLQMSDNNRNVVYIIVVVAVAQ
jgi:hypothetical protein